MSAQTSKVVPFRASNESVVRHAEVIAITANYIVLDVDGKSLEAHTAFSCLIAPMTGDKVCFVTDDHGGNHILGILERKDSQDMTLNFPANVALSAQAGNISLLGSQGVSLLAKQITQISDKVLHKSKEAMVDFEEVVARGNSLQSNYENVRTVAGVINTIAKQGIEQFKGYVRQTEGLDQVKSSQMTRMVKGLFSMDSKHTVMVSKKDTKIDGEHLHLG